MKTIKGVLAAALVAFIVIIMASVSMASDPEDAGISYFSGAGEFGFNLGNYKHHAAGVYMSNRIEFEGTTVDAYEAFFIIPDPSGADVPYTFPTTSGTVALTNSSMSGTFTGTVTGTVNGTITQGGTNAQVMVHNGVSYENVDVSGHAITNAGALSHVVNSVTDTDMGWLTELLIVNSGAVSNTTGSNAIYNGTLFVQPYGNAADAYIINTTLAADGTATVILNGAAPSDYSVQVTRTKP